MEQYFVTSRNIFIALFVSEIVFLEDIEIRI